MDTKQILDRVSRLDEFEVIVQMPPVWRFKGVVPYDMEIVADQAFVRVIASSVEEATSRARAYINSLAEDE